MSAADAPPDQVLPKVALALIRNVASLVTESVLYGRPFGVADAMLVQLIDSAGTYIVVFGTAIYNLASAVGDPSHNPY